MVKYIFIIKNNKNITRNYNLILYKMYYLIIFIIK